MGLAACSWLLGNPEPTDNADSRRPPPGTTAGLCSPVGQNSSPVAPARVICRQGTRSGAMPAATSRRLTRCWRSQRRSGGGSPAPKKPIFRRKQGVDSFARPRALSEGSTPRVSENHVVVAHSGSEYASCGGKPVERRGRKASGPSILTGHQGGRAARMAARLCGLTGAILRSFWGAKESHRGSRGPPR
jgi:hypothetical protein